MRSSPTARLLFGLAVTLGAVAIFSWYALRQIGGLRRLQTETVDRNRRDSLQLLRIQNDLHLLGLAMRDMLESGEPYPLESWKTQFDRIHADLSDAVRVESGLAPESRTPDQQRMLSSLLAQFRLSTDRMFDFAASKREAEARRLIRDSLMAQQAALASTVSRLLVQNNEAEQRAAAAVQKIYDRVEHDVYVFLGAMLLAILATSLYLTQSNRRVFNQLESLSSQRRVLARRLITVQEEVLRSVSRELHDEFGQILTAVGAMLARAEKKGLPPDSPFRAELREVQEIAQSTLDKMRGLAQIFHPTVLDDYGLEKALEWSARAFEKQSGIGIRYEKQGSGPELPEGMAIHVYRILQEALNNVARHSGTAEAVVRVRFTSDSLELQVEDHGRGLPAHRNGGIGMIAMRERAEILRGKLEFSRPAAGGTLVTLTAPLAAAPVSV